MKNLNNVEVFFFCKTIFNIKWLRYDIIYNNVRGYYMENTSKKKNLILYDNNIMKGLLLLSLPIMLNNIIKALNDFVDTFMVSKIVDLPEIVSAQISSIGFVAPIMSMCQALAIGLMTAGAALMSQYVGAKKDDKASVVSGQLLVLCAVAGLLFNILLYILAPGILKLMNATGHLYKYSLSYLRIRSFEMSALFMFYAYQATRQSQGDTVTPVIINVSSILLNIIFTALFIMVFNLGVAGAAIGTVIGNVAVIPVCLIHMAKSTKIKLTKDTVKPNFHYSKKIFLFGMPAAIAQASTSLGFLIINGMMAGYDQTILTPITIGNRINSMLLLPVMGIGTVLATFVGQNIGAENIARAKKTFVTSIKLSLIITIAGAGLIFPLREALAKIFLTQTPEIKICVKYLNYLMFGLPLMGLFQCINGVFQGAGRTELVLILAATRLWIFRIPLFILMLNVFDVGYQAVWINMVISNFGAIVLGFILYTFVDYRPKINKLHQKIKQEINNA